VCPESAHGRPRIRSRRPLAEFGVTWKSDLSAIPVNCNEERTAALLRVNNAIITSLKRDELVRSVSSAIHAVIPFDKFGLSIYDAAAEKLILVAMEGAFPSNYFSIGREMSLEQSLSGEVYRTRRAVVRRNLLFERRYPTEELLSNEAVRSLCNVPVIVQGKTLGVIGLASLRENAYRQADADLLQEFAGQVGLAILNMQAYETLSQVSEERRKTAARLKALLQLNNVIVSNLSRAELFHSICRILREQMACDSAGLALFDTEANDLRIFALEGEYKSGMEIGNLIDIQGRVSGHAFDFRKPYVQPDLSLKRMFTFEYKLHEEGLRSCCLVPLIVRGETIGALGIGSREPDRYRTADVEFLQELSAQIGIGMANLNAYEEISVLKARLEAENIYLQEEIRQDHNFHEIVGDSPVLLETLALVEQVAPTDSTVLLLGETGTGKELIARAIHDSSPRKDRPLVKVNCGALSAGLVESELFGHVKGAFTGALADRDGRFKLANGGTLFLDEVGELAPETQVKLLRVLQEQEFEPLGSNRTLKVDVRIVAATNRDLEGAVRELRFRSDLYYRLRVFPIRIPPLRDRREDIPLLITFFLQKFCRRFSKNVSRVPDRIMQRLLNYAWPGNLRELQNVVERAVVVARGETLELEPTFGFFPRAEEKFTRGFSPRSEAHGRSGGTPADTSLRDIEKRHIESILEQTGWKIEGPSGAAQILNVQPSTLRSRMQKLGIRRPKSSPQT
jgi:formate hydrogenlyase transcriptional activator